MVSFMWSPAMWSLNGNHITGTTFLYKIVQGVNQQTIHQINIKCIVCRKKKKKIVFSPSVDTYIFLNLQITLCQPLWMVLQDWHYSLFCVEISCYNNITRLLFQISHHPPVSAFYCTNRPDGFAISGSVLTKSKFYGRFKNNMYTPTWKLVINCT